MKSVNVHEAKTELSKLLNQVETKGTIITICRYGKPVAELSPVKPKALSPLQKYAWVKSGKILGDITKPVW